MNNSGTSYDPYFNNSSSPLNNPVRKSGISFDNEYQIQNKFATFSNVRVIGTLTVDVGGTLLINTPIVTLDNVAINGTSAFAGTATFNAPTTFNAPVRVNETNVTFSRNSGTSSYISMANTGGTERMRLEVGSDNFSTTTSDSYHFVSNTSNYFKEVFGPTAQTADAIGVHAFRVTDSSGFERFALRSNGQLSIGGNTSGAAANTDAANLFVDNGGAGGSHRLMVQFHTGTAIVLATES